MEKLKINFEDPAVSFLKNIIMFEKSQLTRSVNLLIRYLERNGLRAASCKDLFVLESRTILKIRGISALGYVYFCEKIEEEYLVEKNKYPFFSAYADMKELLQKVKYAPKNEVRRKLKKR